VAAALVGHVIEIHAGFTTATTGFLFWAFAAMLASEAPACLTRDETTGGSEAAARQSPSPDLRPGLITALIGGTLIFGFFSAITGNLWQETALAPLRFVPLRPHLSLAILLAATLGAGILMGLPSGAADSSRTITDVRRVMISAAPGAVTALGISGAFCLLMWTAHKFTADPALTAGLWQTACFYLLVLVILCAVATSGRLEKGTQTLPAPRPLRIVAAAIIVGIAVSAVTIIYAVNLRCALADVFAREGRMREARRQWDEAALFYQRAMDADPFQAHYHSALGQCLEAGAFTAENQQRRLERSERAHLRALELAPRDPRKWVNLARLYGNWSRLPAPGKRDLRFQQSAAYFEEAIRRAPRNVDVYNSYGQHLAASGELVRAEETYRQSIDLNPAHGPTYLLLGELSVIRANWPQALNAYRKAAALMPSSVEAYSGLGYACIKAGNRELALAAYQEAVGLLPENYNDYKNLALLFQGSGEIGRAISAAHTACQLAPPARRDALRAYLESLRREREKQRITSPFISP
jgi:tetratricopeptide (TPR) repeat protein